VQYWSLPNGWRNCALKKDNNRLLLKTVMAGHGGFTARDDAYRRGHSAGRLLDLSGGMR
jgi:protease II